jgi:hypothetical protein
MSEKRFIQRDNPLNRVSRSKVRLFIGLQVLGVAATVAISQTIAAIGFPVLIIALIPLRTFLMPKWFTAQELDVLDALTADNPSVLVSFGGTPSGMKADGPMEGGAGGLRDEEAQLHPHSAMRQRAGSIHRKE